MGRGKAIRVQETQPLSAEEKQRLAELEKKYAKLWDKLGRTPPSNKEFSQIVSDLNALEIKIIAITKENTIDY